MNDFTLRQLNFIADALTLMTETCTMQDEIFNDVSELEMRVEYMIENYCEHKKYIENTITAYQCEQCGDFLND